MVMVEGVGNIGSGFVGGRVDGGGGGGVGGDGRVVAEREAK